MLGQENIRIFGEKGSYKYLGKSEVNIIKQMKRKEEVKKDYQEQPEKLLKTKLCKQKSNQKNKYRDCLLCKILWILLKLDIR